MEKLNASKIKAISTFGLLVVAAFVVLILIIGICGGMNLNKKNNHLIAPHVLTPHFNLNGRTYWLSGNGQTSLSGLPSGYRSAGNTSTLKDFQGPFGQADTQVFMDSDHPDAVFLFVERGKPVYLLFTTQKLLENLINYDGHIYQQENEIPADHHEVPWKASNSYRYVGTVTQVDYTKIPSHAFETNFSNSLGCKVYASPSRKQCLYLEQTQGSAAYYLEFKME